VSDTTGDAMENYSRHTKINLAFIENIFVPTSEFIIPAFGFAGPAIDSFFLRQVITMNV